MKKVSAHQFALFRVIFGAYLTVHSLFLIPVAAELYSNQGVLPDATLNPTHSIFPNIMLMFNSPLGSKLFVSALALLSVLFTVGFQRRVVAFLLWYGFACLFNRNILTSNPSQAYVGWALLACALIPRGEPFSLGRPGEADAAWEFPQLIWHGAWMLLAFGYTCSGILKCASPSWVNGDALYMVTTGPLARDIWYRELLLQFPLFMKMMTWLFLAFEIFYLPLCLHRKGRFIAWTSMVAMHLGVLSVMNLADLTGGMLMFHLFTFDPEWIPERKQAVLARVWA